MIALLRMTAGLTHWAAAFCVLYALHGLGCAGGAAAVAVGPTSLHHLLLTVAWLGGVVAGVVLTLWLRRTQRSTLPDRVGVAMGWVGAAAIVITGLPIITIPACL
ncbi:MAG: hypothetical protein PGN21_03370 [Sphingomonas paucimobilis]